MMLPVVESGGISMEWYRNSCMNGIEYDIMNQQLQKRQPNTLLFLLYLVGTNAPEYVKSANGVFWGLRHTGKRSINSSARFIRRR